jgi:hypothetical protein
MSPQAGLRRTWRAAHRRRGGTCRPVTECLRLPRGVARRRAARWRRPPGPGPGCVLARVVADPADAGHEDHRGRTDASQHLRVVAGSRQRARRDEPWRSAFALSIALRARVVFQTSSVTARLWRQQLLAEQTGGTPGTTVARPCQPTTGKAPRRGSRRSRSPRIQHPVPGTRGTGPCRRGSRLRHPVPGTGAARPRRTSAAARP